MANEFTSGGGKDSPVPAGVKNRFNWGVWFFGWIWGIGNKTWVPFFVWLGLLVASFVPLVNLLAGFAGLALYIWMGIKGNEWAWQNKQWKSEEDFHRVQRLWAGVGLGFAFLQVVIVYAIIIPVLMASTKEKEMEVTCMKANSVVANALTMNVASNGGKINSNQAVMNALKQTRGTQISDNSIKYESYGGKEDVYKFSVNGECDVAVKNCSFAVENKGKKVCGFYFGQYEVVEKENIGTAAAQAKSRKANSDAYNNYNTYFSQGKANCEQKNYAEAIQDFTKVIELTSGKHRNAYFWRGTAKFYNGDKSGALEDFHTYKKQVVEGMPGQKYTQDDLDKIEKWIKHAGG